MSNIKRFSSRKEVTEFLKEKEIDTSNWSEEKWLSINKSQAEIHIQALAESMWDAMNESVPKTLQSGDWHIPFGGKIDDRELAFAENLEINEETDNELTRRLSRQKVSTARCARLSYMTFDGEIDYEKDIELHDRLLESKHASPMEHCAQAQDNSDWYANFKGWKSYRKFLEESGKI